MTTKAEKDKAKQLQDKCQSVLNALLRDEDNKYCVDCDSKGPRWASWNLGVFLCIRCAGIHRNLGVHISKVKSVNLDSWTPEQVVSLQQMGNSRARAVYEANLPDNFRRPQNDSSLESFIRAKYEHKKYLAREWVPPPLPKVDWEKEIEEEMEKQRRKKKTAVERKATTTEVQVPQLPKPRNPSPKTGRSHQTPNPTTEPKQSDLLNIQNGEDNFSSFLSAPATKEEKKPEEKDPIKTEEESFFNQTAPMEKEKVKLTKDSILALYGNTPTNTFNPQPYPTAYPQNYPVQGTFPAFTPPQTFPITGQPFVAPNPQWNATNQFSTSPAVSYQPSFAPFTQQPGFAAPNPFSGVQTAAVQQQFAGLTLGTPAQGTAGSVPTVTTNLWQ